MTTPLTNPAPPGEWHPYYAGKRWLSEWLEGDVGSRHIRIPVAVQWALDAEPSLLEATPMLMTKHKAWGPAPYVGRPFVYAWWVGVDGLGRQVASQSRVVYTGPADFMYA